MSATAAVLLFIGYMLLWRFWPWVFWQLLTISAVHLAVSVFAVVFYIVCLLIGL